MIIEYKKENEIAFEDLKDKECFFSNGVLYMKIFSQDLKEYNISCVNAISIVNAGCIFRKNCASVPEERSAIPLQTEQNSAGRLITIGYSAIPARKFKAICLRCHST